MKPIKTAPPKTPAARPTGSDDDPGAEDTPQIRALRIAVIVMSLLLVIGFITVIARIIYLTSRSGTAPQAGVTSPVAAMKPEAILPLPAGGSIKSLSMSGHRLAVHYASPLGEGIAIIDLEQGKVVSRVDVAVGSRP